MSTILVKGGAPLAGTVKVSGAKNSALKLIHAAMFSNEDVILDNVPKIGNLEVDMEIIREMGGQVDWVGPNKLVLNGSTLNTHVIPYELGSKYRTAALLAAPLLYRFGKAVVPLPGGCKIGYRPIDRWIETWKSVGIVVTEDEKNVYLEAKNVTGGNISFKISTHMGTENAIMTAAFANGETVITNAAEEPEVDDMIDFCNQMGATVKRDHRTITVTGTNVFKGTKFTVRPDRNEVVTYAVAALVTGGNINIKNVKQADLLAFVNALTKMGCQYEFSKDDMRVWHAGEHFKPIDITTAIAPGFMTDWQSLMTLLLTQVDGTSTIYDTIFIDRFGYTKDLNRMGAKIELLRPSDYGYEFVNHDDSYDLKKRGEPLTVAKVTGPTKLKGTKMHIPDLRAGATLVIAALAAEGKSELTGYENVVRGYEGFAEKLANLGAELEVID